MQPAKNIQAYLLKRFPIYLETLRKMVAINSFTANPQGVNTLGALTADIFTEFGFKTEAAPSTNPVYGNHLFLTRPATRGAGRDKAAAIALVSHLDTVYPPEEEATHDFSWRVDGDRIYGPGTVDVKGGTVMIYMLIDALNQHAPELLDRVHWYICLNACEEVLSEEFGQLCLQRLPENTRACLVFESGMQNEGQFAIVTARKGRATYQVRVEGKGAHAGNYHANGANAIVQLAKTIQDIAGMTDYQRELTFNVGVVRGGTVVNRVPSLAEAEVEMRTFSPAVFAEAVAGMLALQDGPVITSADGYPCRVVVNLLEQTAPWSSGQASQGLYDIWERAARQLGLSVVPERRGGLSDANLLGRRFPTLDGLGPSGANAHCSERSPDGSKDQEYVLRSSFLPKALLNLAALQELIS